MKTFLALSAAVFIVISAGVVALGATGDDSTFLGTMVSISSLPTLQVRDFVPRRATITDEFTAQLVPHSPAAVVVEFDQPSTALHGPNVLAKDFVVLSWSTPKAKWAMVFNGATPAPKQFAEFTSYFAPPLPPGAEEFNLTVVPIADAPDRTDLAFWAHTSFGANLTTVVAVVHANRDKAGMVYGELFPDNQDVVQPAIVGPPGQQQLRLPIGWLLPDNPECCPTRVYVETVGLRHSAWVVTSSTQSWLGVTIGTLNMLLSNPGLSIHSVTPGGPSAGLLRPGDVVIGVKGERLASNGTGPSLIDTLARDSPGTTVELVVRHGARTRLVHIKLSSTASPLFNEVEANAIALGNGEYFAF